MFRRTEGLFLDLQDQAVHIGGDPARERVRTATESGWVAGPQERLAWFLVLSAVPGALVGALLGDVITELFGHPWQIALFLVLFLRAGLYADSALQVLYVALGFFVGLGAFWRRSSPPLP